MAGLTGKVIRKRTSVLSLFVVAAVAAALLTMATALSVTDFLQLIFPVEDNIPNMTGGEANPVLRLLQKVYMLLAAQGTERALMLYAILLLSIYGLKNIFSYTAVVTFARFKTGVMRELRDMLHRSVMRQDFAGWSAQQQGQWLSVMSSDMVEYESNVLDSLSMLLQSLITMTIYIMMLIYLDWRLTLLVVLVMAVGTLLLSASRRLKRQSRNLQDLNGQLMVTIQETLDSLKEIKAATAIDFVNSRQREQNAVFSHRRVSIYRRINAASPLSDFLGNTIVVAILIIGAYRVLGGNASLSPSMFISYIMIYVLLLTPIKEFSNAVAQLKKGRGVEDRIAERIESTLNNNPQPADKTPLCHNPGLVNVDTPAGNAPEQLPPINSLELKDVCFGYGDGLVLNHMNWRLAMHQHTAVTGESGSGKTTLGRLVVGLLEPLSGEVLINGERCSAAQRRGRIAYIPQEPMLFNDTLEANIRFGREWVDRRQVEEAADMAQLGPMLCTMPEGMQTVIGDGGGRLSGGERQRVSIARALVGNPQVIVMDEATAALDSETEQHFIDSLQQSMAERTLIVIAHRASTISRCHEILRFK